MLLLGYLCSLYQPSLVSKRLTKVCVLTCAICFEQLVCQLEIVALTLFVAYSEQLVALFCSAALKMVESNLMTFIMVRQSIDPLYAENGICHGWKESVRQSVRQKPIR